MAEVLTLLRFAAAATQVAIPSMFITRRLGQQLLDALAIGKSISISFKPSSVPSRVDYFENLAAYSSQGPTRDFRVKPDLVAPGTITSARRLTTVSSPECGTVTMGVSQACAAHRRCATCCAVHGLHVLA